MVKTRRSEATALRKQHFLAEAARIIGERGYFGFGLQELAERCGVTKPGLLHHFGSKEQLLIELLRERDHANAAAVGSLLKPDDFEDVDVITREGLFETLRGAMARGAAEPEMLRLYAVLSLEALNPLHPAHAFFASRDAAIRDLFKTMLQPHSDNPRSTALQLLSAMKGLEQEWLRTPDAFDLIAEWDALLSKIID